MVRFVEENRELPKALLDLLAFCRSPRGKDRLEQWVRLTAGGRALLFAGMGTSEFTSEAMAFRLSVKGRHSRSFDAGELSRQEGVRVPPDACCVLTSQSGESIEIRNLASMPWIGPYVAVTNDEASALARGAALTLPLCAGPEESITTKTYVNNLALFKVLEASLDGAAAADRMIEALEQAAGAMERLDEAGVEAAAEHLMSRGLPTLAFAGRGEAVVSARQCGLTFMEGLKRPACAFAGGAFRHGPFECVGPGLGLVLFRSSPATAELMDGMARDAAGHGSPVVVVDACGGPAVEGAAMIRVAATPAADQAGLFPILAARTHNHLLHVLATRLGIETGHFLYGSKVTLHE